MAKKSRFLSSKQKRNKNSGVYHDRNHVQTDTKQQLHIGSKKKNTTRNRNNTEHLLAKLLSIK